MNEGDFRGEAGGKGPSLKSMLTAESLEDSPSFLSAPCRLGKFCGKGFWVWDHRSIITDGENMFARWGHFIIRLIVIYVHIFKRYACAYSSTAYTKYIGCHKVLHTFAWFSPVWVSFFTKAAQLLGSRTFTVHIAVSTIAWSCLHGIQSPTRIIRFQLLLLCVFHLPTRFQLCPQMLLLLDIDCVYHYLLILSLLLSILLLISFYLVYCRCHMRASSRSFKVIQHLLQNHLVFTPGTPF